MQSPLSAISFADQGRIRQAILDKYQQVARSPLGQFRYPTGRAGLAAQGYDPVLLARLPQAVLDTFVGVGNPLALARPRPGETVLDIGCGAGVDTLLAALLAGPNGWAVGLEYSPAMTARAAANRRQSGIANAAFAQGSAEALPFADESVDVVVSSGVFNLVVDKERALAEAWRVLKPGGRLQVADQMLTALPSLDQAAMIASWFT